jgi:hypothetical protein
MIRKLQESHWLEKYGSMEIVLELDAKQAEKQRDEVQVTLNEKDLWLSERLSNVELLENEKADLISQLESLQTINDTLEEKSIWGTEVEKVIIYINVHI